MTVFTDQAGRNINVKKAPKRIISVVPSQTEFLYDLGLEDEIAGITKFCVHPEKWLRSKPIVGGTKQLNSEAIKKLQPDLIIAGKEENIKSQIEELANEYPVWVSDVNSLDSAYLMMEQIGRITNKEIVANEIISGIKQEFQQLPSLNSPLKTCYLIWKNPFMTVGGDTFIHSILKTAGFENLFKDYYRYPEITVKQLQSLDPEILFLSSEPFPFSQKHINELQPYLPGTKIILVDGELFSWYGSRLLYTPKYLLDLCISIQKLRLRDLQ